MSELTEDERVNICCGHVTCQKVIAEHVAARTRAVEQERDSVQFALDGFRQVAQKDNEYLIARAEAAEQRLEQLQAAVLALADEEDRIHWHVSDADDEDGCMVEQGRCVDADEVRALVSDPTALDRVRQEAVEAALAPIESVLAQQEQWAQSAVLDISGRVGEERRTSGKATLMNVEEIRVAVATARDTAWCS